MDKFSLCMQCIYQSPYLYVTNTPLVMQLNELVALVGQHGLGTVEGSRISLLHELLLVICDDRLFFLLLLQLFILLFWRSIVAELLRIEVFLVLVDIQLGIAKLGVDRHYTFG